MTCTQCGAMLVPGSAFCGGCGRPAVIAPPVVHNAPPPGQPQYAAPVHHPQGHYHHHGMQHAPAHQAMQHAPAHQAMQHAPAHQAMQHAPAHQAMQHAPAHQAMQHAPAHQAMQHAPAHQAMQHAPAQQLMHWQPGPGGSPHATPPLGQQHVQAPPLHPFPIIMQQRLTRLTGQMFLAPTRLYFICESTKGGLTVAIGKSVGGLIGGVIAGIGVPVPGQSAPMTDEAALYRAVQERQGSLVMEPAQIKQIKDTFWTHAIWFNGLTYALPEELHKDLKRELGLWCQANGVKSAGLLPK
ncbi:MAG: hypothetical protein AB7O24_29265 [Kofleriaceae bacterium]